MIRHRALAGLSLLALAGTAALVPVTASAAPASIEVDGASVQFAGVTSAAVSVSYTCGSTAAPAPQTLRVTVSQRLSKKSPKATASSPEDGLPVQCDGVAHAATPVPLEVRKGAFANGAAEATLQISSSDDEADDEAADGDDDGAENDDRAGVRDDDGHDDGDDDGTEDESEDVRQAVTVVGVPAPVVALSTDASPEPAREGKTIKVLGTVTRGDKAVKVKAKLYFAPDGGDPVVVRTVQSSKKGALSTTVKAVRSGTFTYAYGSVFGEGDRIDVIPAVRGYKGCAALNAVYPHGVGRTGAVDQGGTVADFTVDDDVYKKNRKNDLDRDGIACES